MSARHWSSELEALDACEEAVEFAREYPSLRAAWTACERPDWMLWLLAKSLPDDPTTTARRKFAGCVNAIAKRSLKHAGKYRKQIEPTIRAVDRWARNDPRMTLELLSAARSAALSSDDAAWSAEKKAQCRIIRKHYPAPRIPKP